MTRIIAIKTVLNGFVVKVGCQTVVFTSRADLVNHIDQYLKTEDPYQYEKTFLDSALNARKLGFGSEYKAANQLQDASVPGANPCIRTLDDAFDTI